jgi:hypothetical protein
MQVEPFYQEALRVIQSGPWDAASFGIVTLYLTNEEGQLEANIDLMSENPIQFEIDYYYWQGSNLYLNTRGVVKWVFQALD